MDKISENISFKEATKSDAAIRLGIKNIPSEKELEAMKAVAENIFEPLRKWHGKPIAITSFYRSKELNKKIGGSPNSQHCLGEAIDIDADIYNNGISNKNIFEYILNNLEFDQLIWEFGDNENPAWVHVSFTQKRKNRKEVLKAIKENGKTKYVKYDHY